MTLAALALAWLTLLALAVVAYAYVGYPIVLAACSRLFGSRPRRPVVRDDEWPSVTLVISALNEEHEIGPRIRNALASDYPKEKFRVVIASDGSTDATCQIVRGFEGQGVRLVAFPHRRGKASVLNDVLPWVKTDLVMLSDANTYTRPDAVRKLAAWFADPRVGVVCGRLVLTDSGVGRNADGVYWKYETFLKKCEARLGALLGSNGAIYALRKSAYRPIPADTIVDDFVIPLLAKKASGCEIVYDAEAVATEETPADISSEFHRRARIGAGGFQAIGMLKGLLRPRHGWLAFAFFNHKVLRWLGPFFLLGALLMSVLLVVICMPGLGAEALLPPAALLLASQVAFYTLSLLSGVLPQRPRCLRVLRLPAMFTSMNFALAVGFWRFTRGRQNAAWRRTARAGESAAAVALLATLDDTKEMLALQVRAARTPNPEDSQVWVQG